MILGSPYLMKIGEITQCPFRDVNGTLIKQPSMILQEVSRNDWINYWLNNRLENQDISDILTLHYKHYYRVSVD